MRAARQLQPCGVSQLRQARIEPARQLAQVDEHNVVFARLVAAEIGAVYARIVHRRLLRQAALDAQSPHDAAQRHEHWKPVVLSRIPRHLRPLFVCGTFRARTWDPIHISVARTADCDLSGFACSLPPASVFGFNT